MELPEIHAADKSLSGPMQWVETDGGRLNLASPLEIDGVTIEGLLLRGRANKDHPEEEVMLQLDWAQPQRRDHGFDRIDWRPLHTHNNRGAGPPQFRFIDMAFSHHHAFDLNWLATELRLRQTNLPIAQPINQEPGNFSGLLAFAKLTFRIKNIELLPAPPWERGLFSGLNG